MKEERIRLLPENAVEPQGSLLLAKALHRRDPYIQSLIQQHSEGSEEREKMVAAKAWDRNEGGSRDFYLKLAADVIADMEKADGK